MINVISAADIAFTMSSSTSAWLLSPFVPLRNKMAERFASVSEDELCEKCMIKQLLNSVVSVLSAKADQSSCMRSIGSQLAL